jgi:hypothetical protein
MAETLTQVILNIIDTVFFGPPDHTMLMIEDFLLAFFGFFARIFGG